MARKGVLLWRNEKLNAKELGEFARRAEGAGFDTLWCPETWIRDATVQLAVLAQATSAIRLGSGVFNLFSRSPGLLAQTAAELDVLSGGRFALGIGVSGQIVIENWHSQPFERLLLRTRETIAALRMAFSGERVNLEGKTIRMKGFKLSRPPVQNPLPIYNAANGPQNTRLTGEVADGWLPLLIPFSRMADAMAPLVEGARQADRPPSEIDVAPYLYTAPGDDLDRARRLVKPQLGFYVGAMGVYYHAQLTRWGYGREADAIRAGWKESGRPGAAQAVPDALTDDLALCGPVPRIAEQLARLREAGVTQPIFRFPEDMEKDEVERALEAMGRL